MGNPCSTSAGAVAPVSLDAAASTGVQPSNVNRKIEINIIWLGSKSVPFFDSLRREYNQVHAFNDVQDSIEMMNSLTSINCHFFYIVHDHFVVNTNLNTVVNKIAPLKQIRAVYVYHEDSNIPENYPSICTVSNINHLTQQINMVANHLGIPPSSNVTIADTVIVDREDMRLEVHQNTINALLNSAEELKFPFNEDQVINNNNQKGKKDKQKNLAFEAEAVISNVNISFVESNATTLTNTVNITFTATVKVTLISFNIPLYKASLGVKPGFSITSVVQGDGVMTFSPEKNTFDIEASKAIAANIDLRVWSWKDYDVGYLLSPWSLPGPLNLSQVVPMLSTYTATTDQIKETRATIVDLKMRSHNQRIILSLKLNYSTLPHKNIA